MFAHADRRRPLDDSWFRLDLYTGLAGPDPGRRRDDTVCDHSRHGIGGCRRGDPDINRDRVDRCPRHARWRSGDSGPEVEMV